LDCIGRASVVLANLRLILRYVQAGCVGYIEDVEFKLRLNLFSNPEALAEGEIETLLRRLAEDIALTHIEGGLVHICRIAAG